MEQLSIAEGLYYSIICNEDLATLPSDPTASPLFMGVNLVEEKLAVCASWPKRRGSQARCRTPN